MNAHTIGSKYDETKNLGLADLAKLIRADIKALAVPGLKVSVRISRYSMGQSIELRVTEAPFVSNYDELLADDKLVADIVADRRCDCIKMPWLTDAAREVHLALEAIHDSYNYDNSDSMTDYFHTRFAGSVSWRIKSA